ncbi:hypothetical protein OG241_36570 [Streptomyces sp. NBC_01390]|uniref:hypothetical protein n=1 Tax=Streptomyces sp. NBC_01390 TaxID=2903850 RepID=UPI00324B6D5B
MTPTIRATVTTPTAPATAPTTIPRLLDALFFRRCPRAASPCAPAPTAVIAGSSAVASYAFCQPWAAAGSAYASYDGAGRGSTCGWYTVCDCGEPAESGRAA